MVIKEVEQTWLDDLKQRAAVFEQHRESIENAKISELSAKGLDSALKKTTAFMKKLKTLSSTTVPSLIEDLGKVNLSKFIEEISQAIAEAKIKSSEVPTVVQLCVAITCRYAAFPELLLAELKKGLPQKKADKITNPAKLRIDLRFLSELILSGVFSRDGMQVLGAALSYLCLTDKTEFCNVGLIAFICRSSGWFIARLVPKTADGHAEIVQVDIASLPVNSQFTEKDIQNVFGLFDGYFNSLVEATEKACTKMNKAHKAVMRQQRIRGDAGDEEKSVFEEAKQEYEKLKSLMSELASALGRDAVEMREELSEDEETDIANKEFSRALKEGGMSIWPDDEAKSFYEGLLDIRTIVPKNLYKESEVRTVPTERMQDSVDAIDVDSVVNTSGQDVQPIDTSNFPSDDTSRENSPIDGTNVLEVVVDSSSFGTEEMKAKWQKFSVDLDHLMNKSLVDEAALFFVSNLNTKAYRKRLVKVLLSVSFSRMDILPFYARLICSLNNVMPDVTTEVINQLIQQFREIVQPIKKESVRVEEKIKCSIFITELMKFGMIPRAEGLSCLRQLVYYFHGHLIDMAAAMIENGGMYLYRSVDTHSKMESLLNVVQTKKARLKDERQIMLIENAYFACIPPESGRKFQVVEVSPMELYIRHLILDVTEKTVDETMRCLRRIDWADSKVRGWAMYYFSSPWLVPFAQLQHLANVVSGLYCLPSNTLDWIGVQIVDNLCETIRMSLEVPTIFNQYAVASIKFLGELYNYQTCESPVIFTTLYNLISFDAQADIVSPDLFRLQLVCELLCTVGEYFHKGSNLIKMNYFLIYFNKYYWLKRAAWLQAAPMGEDEEQPIFPIEVEVKYNDCMRYMGKKSSLPGSLNEANARVAEMEAGFKEKMAAQSEEEEEEPEERRKTEQMVEEGPTTDDDIGAASGRSYSEGDESSDLGDETVVLKAEEPKIGLEQEDEDFIKEFDRMYQEIHRNAQSITPASAVAELSLPATAKAGHKKITFAESPHHDADNDDTDMDENEMHSGAEKVEKVKLMIRGKSNKPTLKTVGLDNERLHEAWAKQREQEAQRKEELKRLTLGHSIRQQAEEEEEQYSSFKKHFEGKRKRNPMH